MNKIKESDLLTFLNRVIYNEKAEKEYEVHRYDIKTSEKKILRKYTDTIKAHDIFDIRLEENNNEQILNIKEYSIQKIFSLINEFP